MLDTFIILIVWLCCGVLATEIEKELQGISDSDMFLNGFLGPVALSMKIGKIIGAVFKNYLKQKE